MATRTRITVTILKDIQVRPGESIFYRRSSQLKYDTKAPLAKKQHMLVYQQGDRYGEIGDMCDYLSQAQLLALAESGHIRITGMRGE